MQTSSRDPTLRAVPGADRLELAAAGPWTALHASTLESLIGAAPLGQRSRGSVRIDLAGIGELDTFGAWLLERLFRACREGAREASFVGVPERYRGLLDEMTAVNREPPPARREANKLLVGLDGIGRAIEESGKDAGRFAAMLGALGAAFARVVVRPRTFRLTSAVHQLDRVGWQAIGIILLITFLIGGIIAQQGIFHFRRFGAEDYVVDLVGILVLREIGVLIVAIMVAGRSGSAYTAELGSMKMREEIDALRRWASTRSRS